MKNYVIILAAGTGQRLQNQLPKQFLVLGDRPVVMHTMQAFFQSAVSPEIILVLGAAYVDYWKSLCVEYGFFIPHTIVIGGKERFHSVKNALNQLNNEGLVGVHDAVRPFVTEEVITDAYQSATIFGNGVPAVPATNTIRHFDGLNASQAVDRSRVYIVQNPQVFRVSDLQTAYKQDYIARFTDDAIVAEDAGMTIHLVKGDQRNMKITHPADLYVANGILAYNLAQRKTVNV